MSWVAAATVGGAVVGGYITGEAQKSAASKASRAEIKASEAGIREQRQQFEEIQKLLSPFVQAGETAIGAQQALLGLSGEEAQQKAIQQVEDSPQFQALTESGEEAILQRASATGGLRGGDVQRSLAQFRPSILSNLIENQFSRLGSLSSLGQASAAGVGSAGQQTGANVSSLLQKAGQARAGEAIAVGQAQTAPFTGFVQGTGLASGLGLGPFGQSNKF